MASSLPGWQKDPDRPTVLAMGLEARNALLYGEFRDYPEWRQMVQPPDWSFARNDALNIQLRELWMLIAETHFIHAMFGLLPDLESLRMQREIQALAADETAGHVQRVLERLRAFAERHQDLSIELAYFDVDWAGWWPRELEYEALSKRYEGGADAIVTEVAEEILHGSRFNVTAEQMTEGLMVITAGGEFPSETVIIVLSFDADSQIARCQDLATQAIKDIPLANLRDHQAAREEVQARIGEMLAGEVADGRPFAAERHRIELELLDEVRNGTRFAVTADKVEVGMMVCCVGSVFDPMEMATVIEWDPASQTAVCQSRLGITAPVNLAGLRDVAAVIQEMQDRVMALVDPTPPGATIIITDEGPPVPPPFTPN